VRPTWANWTKIRRSCERRDLGRNCSSSRRLSSWISGSLQRDRSRIIEGMARKNAAAVALGRKGGRKGGQARAAKLTSQQRSESARKAGLARWPKVKGLNGKTIGATKGISTREKTAQRTDTSDQALAALLNRLRATVDPVEIRQLSDQIERIVFHKQYMNA
jgi:hypothetical protein